MILKEEISKRWDEIFLFIKKEYNISDVSYKTWLKHLSFYDVDENILYISVDDSQIGENAIPFIETKYNIFIKTAIAELIGEELEIKFVPLSKIVEKNKKKESEAGTEEKKHTYNNYTFDNFIVGENNKMAQASALAVAEFPATDSTKPEFQKYNPLFIYGGSGLGKTHLMCAIANYLIENRPDLKVLYVSSETFINDLVRAIREKTNDQFRERYRNNDVLLVDDIQMIIGKESTQEEFFNTFNDMKNQNKQIVISSDKPPRDMHILDERIRSRLSWGMTVDIQPPSYETRMAILKSKAAIYAPNIDEEILKYIAQNIKSNIRDLEGAFTKVVGVGKLQNRPLSVELAEDALKDMICPEERKNITPSLVIDIVSEHYNLTALDMRSKNRGKFVAYPRQICMYLCRTLTNASLDDIGKELGNRDHATILHGFKKIESDLQTDPALKQKIDILIKKINPPE